MTLKVTTKFKYANGSPRKFWGCVRFPECKGTHGANPDGTHGANPDGTHGANPDGSPVGIPANKETKTARIQAHEAFDGYWKKKNLSRSEGYKLLQKLMEMSAEQAHIGNFTKEECETLIKKINTLQFIDHETGRDLSP